VYNADMEAGKNRAIRADARLPRAARWDAVLAAAALVIILGYLLAPPHSLLDKADHAAYAVCHRIPARSFTLAGRPLPLCARCSGTYLAATVGLIVLAARGRGRAGRFPAHSALVVLGVFLLCWAVDGFNSFLALFPGLPYLYEPRNLLRLITGALEGVALAAILLPLANQTLWATPGSQRSIGAWRDLGWMLVAAVVVIVLVGSEWPPLLYPLAILSELAILGLVGTVNAMFVLILTRREGRATRPREVMIPLLLGIALAAVELSAIGLARAALTARLGLPF
jgi:uncharacterized membrane protein